MTDVLDHGYVHFIESWGSDERIIEAARMSTNKGFQGWGTRPCPGCKHSPIAGSIWQKVCIDDGMGTEMECPTCKGAGALEGDGKLLRYLWEHNHHTPFEMAGLTIEVQAPIFVFREWHRHRTQSYNELSARYTTLPNLYYVPSHERLMGGRQSSSNKQSSQEGFTAEQAEAFASQIRDIYAESHAQYEDLVSNGLAREIARTVVPVGCYSRMRASANLRNWLGFLTLRTAEGAQWEIRQYANAVADMVAERFPRTYALWNESQ